MVAPEAVHTLHHDPRLPDREGQAEAILPFLVPLRDAVTGAFLTLDPRLRPNVVDLPHIHHHPVVVALSADRHPVTGSPSVDETAEVEVVHFLDRLHLAIVVGHEAIPDHCLVLLRLLATRLDDAILQLPVRPEDDIPLHLAPHVAKTEIGLYPLRDPAPHRVAETMVEGVGADTDRYLVHLPAPLFQLGDVGLPLSRVQGLLLGLQRLLHVRVDNAAALAARSDVVPLAAHLDVQERRTFCEPMQGW